MTAPAHRTARTHMSVLPRSLAAVSSTAPLEVVDPDVGTENETDRPVDRARLERPHQPDVLRRLRVPEALRLLEGQGRPPDARRCTTTAGPWCPTGHGRRRSATCSASTSTACGPRCSRTDVSMVAVPTAASAARATTIEVDFPRPERSARRLVAHRADAPTWSPPRPDGRPSTVPAAYGDDAERNAGYTALAGTELLDRRLEALDVVERTIERDRDCPRTSSRRGCGRSTTSGWCSAPSST